MNGDIEKQIRLRSYRSELLQRRAWELGIEIPKEWWTSDLDLHINNGVPPDQLELLTRHFLTEEGEARLKFLVQDAEEKREDLRLERRQKRLAFYQIIFSLLFGLTGWILGLYALFTRK